MHRLIRFENYNHCSSFEMRQPMFQIYTSISDIYKFEDAIFVSYDGLDMVSS